MLSELITVFKRAKNCLPDEVTASLDAASILPRDIDHEDGPRVAVSLGAGIRGAFIFSKVEADRRFRARWPELSDTQVKRAIEYLNARVKIATLPNKRLRRKNWILDY